ncbi:DUF11 domain-containing protein [Deinococcus sp. S9]|uniref:DUF11 domain-containing protein n=1 Tax=Deinococcus sp. S9 TaxID=2545754 RepID=UPI0010546FD9|nr:DUF11 domain-containing protein [Deinococcus sp. S9]TDE84811.1 DUF11 domain-containing protein [Deinococcus sp. S9]
MKRRLITALLAVASAASAAGTPAGTTITNTASLESVDDAGQDVSTPSNAVTLTVRHVAAVDITPNGSADQPGQTVIGVPGQNGVLTYQIQNPSNGPDVYDLTTQAAPGTDAGQVTYWEDDGDGAFDPARDQAVISIRLQPDEQKTFFATYPVPADASSDTSYTFGPVATSEADHAVQDSGNQGRIRTQQVLSITFGEDGTGNATSPGSVSYTHTLRNTGNTPLTAQNLALTSQGGSWSYTYRVGDAAPAATVQDALAAWTGTLARGESLPVRVTVTAPNGLAGGTQDTLTLGAAITATPSDAVDNQTLAPQTLTDVTTILKGVPGATKTARSCGADPSCAAPTTIQDNLIAPNEYVLYTVTGTNGGNGGLRRPVLKDTLPPNLRGVSFSGAASSVGSGQVLYSLDGQSWNTLAPNIKDAEGATVYVGWDSNADGAVTVEDTLAPGASLTLKLVTVVK